MTFEECLLRRIFGILPLAQQRIDERKNTWFQPIDQRFKGLPFAISSPAESIPDQCCDSTFSMTAGLPRISGFKLPAYPIRNPAERKDGERAVLDELDHGVMLSDPT